VDYTSDFGDLFILILIKWFKNEFMLKNFILQSLFFYKIWDLKDTFTSISFIREESGCKQICQRKVFF
jgi:hypothetical protein